MSEHGTGRFGFALPDDQASRDRLAEIGQLASGLVHELKNPLGAIDINAQLLLDQLDRDHLDRAKAETRLQRIQTSSRHLREIIDSFLTFARPGRPDRDRVDVNALLRAVLDELAPLLEQARIHVILKVDEALAAVPADVRQLRSVFFNIIVNAHEALLDKDGERTLLIATRNRKGRISVVVANNGPPLSQQAAAHLFEPFYSEKEHGTGLGLAIVRRLLELHGGSVQATSDPNQGVSFAIELPTDLGPARALRELPMPEAETEVAGEATPPPGQPTDQPSERPWPTS